MTENYQAGMIENAGNSYATNWQLPYPDIVTPDMSKTEKRELKMKSNYETDPCPGFGTLLRMNGICTDPRKCKKGNQCRIS